MITITVLTVILQFTPPPPYKRTGEKKRRPSKNNCLVSFFPKNCRPSSFFPKNLSSSFAKNRYNFLGKLQKTKYKHVPVRVPADSEVPVAVLEFALAFVLASVLASVLAFDHVVETCLGVVRKTGVAVQAGTSPDFARAAESFAEADLRREMQYFFPHPDFWVSFRGRGQFRFRRYFASVGPNPRFYEFPPRRVAAAPNDIPAEFSYYRKCFSKIYTNFSNFKNLV